jgi:hypothetical protein
MALDPEQAYNAKVAFVEDGQTAGHRRRINFEGDVSLVDDSVNDQMRVIVRGPSKALEFANIFTEIKARKRAALGILPSPF